jgi:hypothetical protein
MPANGRWDLIRRLKVKHKEVMFALEQAVKAQTVRRGTALLFL